MFGRHVSSEHSKDASTHPTCTGATHKIHGSLYRHSQCAGQAVQGVQKGQEESRKRAEVITKRDNT